MDPLHPTADQRDVVRWGNGRLKPWLVHCKGWEEVEVSVYPTFGPGFFRSRLIYRIYIYTYLCLKHAGVQ